MGCSSAQGERPAECSLHTHVWGRKRNKLAHTCFGALQVAWVRHAPTHAGSEHRAGGGGGGH
eukprot:3888716-Alexandrium_andersonii.AAC.1